MKTPFTVHAVGDNATIRYAAEELAKYVGMMSGAPVPVTTERFFRKGAGGLWTGLAAAFGGDGPTIPPVADPRFDDAIGIAARGGDGILAGPNPRSVLLAVYRYLADAGCAWVRPGADGEHVPRRDLSGFAAAVSEAASCRHRGICIEGAVSDEHVRDIIEWMPRNGFNAYFIQFREGYTFYDRWYSRMGDPLRKPEALLGRASARMRRAGRGRDREARPGLPRGGARVDVRAARHQGAGVGVPAASGAPGGREVPRAREGETGAVGGRAAQHQPLLLEPRGTSAHGRGHRALREGASRGGPVARVARRREEQHLRVRGVLHGDGPRTFTCRF